MASTHIIIVAAGSGSRFGGPLPKQFCNLGGRPVLMHTVDAFRRALPGAGITLVLSQDGSDIWRGLCDNHGFDSPAVVTGGPTRYRSVCNAIATLPAALDFIMVHDGARPFPPAALLRDFQDLLAGNYCGLIPAVPVTDSLRMVTADGNRAVDRSEFRAVQTPQIFRATGFLDAYRQVSGSDERLFTDDASVLDACGMPLMLAQGSSRNIKITNPGDIALAEYYLSNPE